MEGDTLKPSRADTLKPSLADTLKPSLEVKCGLFLYGLPVLLKL